MSPAERATAVRVALDGWRHVRTDAAALELFARLGAVWLAEPSDLAHQDFSDGVLVSAAARGLAQAAARLVGDLEGAQRADDEAAVDANPEAGGSCGGAAPGSPVDRARSRADALVVARQRAELAWGAIAAVATLEHLDALATTGQRLRKFDRQLRLDDILLGDAAAARGRARDDVLASRGGLTADAALRARFWWAFASSDGRRGEAGSIVAGKLPRMAAARHERHLDRLATTDGTVVFVTWGRGEPLAVELAREGGTPWVGALEVWHGGARVAVRPIDAPFIALPGVSCDRLDEIALRIVGPSGSVAALGP